jgi:osmotically-inducible protein OsmY
MNDRNYNRGRQNENYANRQRQFDNRNRESSPEWRDEEEYYRSGESRFGAGGHQLFQGEDFGRGFSGGDYEGSLGTYGGHGSGEGVNSNSLYGRGDRSANENSYQDRGREYEENRENSGRRFGYAGYRTNLGPGRPNGRYLESERGYDLRGNNSNSRSDGGYDNERGWWDKTTDEFSSWMGDEEAARRREADHRRHAIHRGRGPKGYTRSDERIKDDINDRLTDYAYLDASDVSVDVSNGDVVLTGTVDTRYAKRMAEDLTEDVSGVKNVENRLRVLQRGSGVSQTASTLTDTSNSVDETNNKSFTTKA